MTLGDSRGHHLQNLLICRCLLLDYGYHTPSNGIQSLSIQHLVTTDYHMPTGAP